MISGQLKDRVDIQEVTTIQDSMGYPAETWKTKVTVWGSFIEEKGSEILKNDRPVAVKRSIVFIRYYEGLTEKNRLRVRGGVWEIENIRSVEKGRRTEAQELVIRRIE